MRTYKTPFPVSTKTVQPRTVTFSMLDHPPRPNH